MIYFSQLKGKRAMYNSHKFVGRLVDCLFLPSDPAIVTKFIIKNKDVKYIFPVEEILSIGKEIKLKSMTKTVEKTEYELSLVKNLLDKQIIDIKGGKVVRVNDVALQYKDNVAYYIGGVDVGFRAILRWFKIEKYALPFYKLFKIYSRPHFLSWEDIEPLELARGNVQLKKDADDLEKMRPEDLADYLERTDVINVGEIINNLDEGFAADVISDLNANFQTALFERFPAKRASQLIKLIDPDDAVDILLTLPIEKRRSILSFLPSAKQKELQNLMKYSKTPIGELINPRFIWVYENSSLDSAQKYVKKTITDSHFSYYVYVKNEDEDLVGVMDLSELIRHSPKKLVRDVMVNDVIVIHLTTPKEITTKKMLKYKLSALPVIDSHRKLLGIIMFDDLVEEVLEKYEAL